jgi:hypothetical protein
MDEGRKEGRKTYSDALSVGLNTDRQDGKRQRKDQLGVGPKIRDIVIKLILQIHDRTKQLFVVSFV